MMETHNTVQVDFRGDEETNKIGHEATDSNNNNVHVQHPEEGQDSSQAYQDEDEENAVDYEERKAGDLEKQHPIVRGE